MFLPMQFSEKMISLFKQTKEVFDSGYILNPNKKVIKNTLYNPLQDIIKK
jgi:hypothetical protein